MKHIFANKRVLITLSIVVLLGVIIAGIIVAPKGNQQSKKIIYLSANGSEIVPDKAENGSKYLVPDNPEMPEGMIFSKWEFVDSLDDVFQSEDDGRSGTGIPFVVKLDDESYKGAHFAIAQGLEIPKGGNVLALGSGYGKKGDTVTLPLQLCGDVEICAYEAVVKFDPKKLKYIEADSVDPDVVINLAEDGEIKLNYMSYGNTVGDVLAANLKFEIIGTKQEIAPVDVEVKNGTSLDGEGNLTDVKMDKISAQVEIVK